jgi:signal transduction histidine kinase
VTRDPPSVGIWPVSAGRRAFYRLAVDTAAGSRREVEAHARAEERLRRQREVLRPLGVVVIAAVAVGAFNGHPAPGVQGEQLGVSAAVVVFAAALAWAVRGSFLGRSTPAQTLVIATMGAAGIALVGLQPKGATELAGGAAVWFAVARLPLAIGVPLAIAVTAALGLAVGIGGGSVVAVLAAMLLCALLALVAYFIKQARASQDVTEWLLARLEDAREEQLKNAAVSERTRIAAELHDVLAHSLSGAAIQLQGARKLAEREHAAPQIGAAIERAAELVREGLANARQAVGALCSDRLPSVYELGSLVSAFRRDADTTVTLTIEGEARPLPANASLALYRGAQEALTNVARYAPGATTTVVLSYQAARTSLAIENDVPARRADRLPSIGGGNGLAGLRERVESTGGSLHAGPTERGWRVELQVPA